MVQAAYEYATQTCTSCQQTKRITDFCRRSRDPYVRHRQCRDCRNEYHRKRSAKQRRKSINQFARKIGKQETIDSIAGTIEPMVSRFRGIENLAVAWKARIDEARASNPGSETLLAHFLAVYRMSKAWHDDYGDTSNPSRSLPFAEDLEHHSWQSAGLPQYSNSADDQVESLQQSTKVCSVCHQIKSINEFRRRYRDSEKRSAECRQCYNAYMMIYRRGFRISNKKLAPNAARQRRIQNVAVLVNAMLRHFGGLKAFCDVWRQEFRSAFKEQRGMRTESRHMDSMIHVLFWSREPLTGRAP